MSLPTHSSDNLCSISEAESTLGALASSFLASAAEWLTPNLLSREGERKNGSTGTDYEARYNALVNHIPAVIFVAPLRAGNGKAYVSPQIESILGFKQEEWLGDPLRWYQQVHPDDRGRWSQEAASLFLSGQPLESVYRVIARDGRVVWFKCDARMVHSKDGTPSFIHGIGFNITEIKEAEASLKRAHDELEMRVAERTQDLERINDQLRKEIEGHKSTEQKLREAKNAAEAAARAKTEFIANISHEIRTPMNGVLGMTNLALATDLTGEQREYISLANSSAHALLNVINQVLDFSKLEAGKTSLDMAPFNLGTNISTLIKEFQYAASAKGLVLVCQTKDIIPECLIGDWGRLRQVLTNLLGNAIKFTHSGSVTFNVDFERLTASAVNSSCSLTFSVTDTGIGIPPEKIALIFDAFSQVDGSVTREFGGTGLGLTISREIVEMMGGKLQAESKKGCGSKFFFTVQLTQARDETAPPTNPIGPQLTAIPKQNHGKLHLLVAEDNPINQKVVKTVLEKRGHRVTIAENGREALDAYGNFSFDLVLMDVQMPQMDGLSATAAIRSLETKNNSLRKPIVGLTAHASRADQDRCLAAGMDVHISKPFKPQELIELVERLASQ